MDLEGTSDLRGNICPPFMSASRLQIPSIVIFALPVSLRKPVRLAGIYVRAMDGNAINSSVGSGRKERCPRSPRLGCVKKSSVDERTSPAHRLRTA